MRLSVVIPVYNEEATLRRLVEAVRGVPFDKEIVIVDDCSTDGSWNVAHAIPEGPGCKIVKLRHVRNMGKGAALRTGFSRVTGDVVIVQDADLEYDPNDIPTVIAPILSDKADVVYGSRFMGGAPQRGLNYWHTAGNRFLTILSNCFTGLNLTDMETCYKCFKREIIQAVDIKENRFGFEPEITAKVAKMQVRIKEVPISYYPRTNEEGKKIGFKDGLRAIYCIWKYRHG